MRVGIVDLGTNTFNLLIAEILEGKPLKYLLNTESAVMLGNEGLDKGFISDKAFTRAYAVLGDFNKMLRDFKCDKVAAFGTSAIRSASNANAFIDKIALDFNIHIELITGDIEAEFIYFGVTQAVNFTDENYLILDIGGGSNEFIIANKDELLWKHSFTLGGARLLEKFKPTDPIQKKEIESVNRYLDIELQLLKDALVEFPITKLVGSSGAFDSFAEMLHFEKTGFPSGKNEIFSHISLDDFNNLYEKIIKTSREDRIMIPGLEDIRVDTIVMASIFTKLTLKLSKATEIIQSAYSLKEGAALNIQK